MANTKGLKNEAYAEALLREHPEWSDRLTGPPNALGRVRRCGRVGYAACTISERKTSSPMMRAIRVPRPSR